MPEKIQIVLSVVRNELRQETKNVLDNHIYFLKNIALLEYNPNGEERREFARLTSLSGLCLGKGESACMTYARFFVMRPRYEDEDHLCVLLRKIESTWLYRGMLV